MVDPIEIKMQRKRKRKIFTPSRAKEVIIACGVDAKTNFGHTQIKEFLRNNATKTHLGYYYEQGKNKFKIRIVYTAEEFRSALDTEGAIVIYYYHSRYGQGPAFEECIPPCPKGRWDNYFRMGYDFVNIPCIEEIKHHSTNPAQIPNKHPKKMFVRKRVRTALVQSKKRLKRKRWEEWGCKFKKDLQRPMSKCSKERLMQRDFWYRSKYRDYITIVKVGSNDLKSVSLKCSVLFMYSCSSRGHYLGPLRRRKKQTKSKCVFYLSTLPVYDTLAPKMFLDLLFKGVNPKKQYRRYERHIRKLGVSAGIIRFYQ